MQTAEVTKTDYGKAKSIFYGTKLGVHLHIKADANGLRQRQALYVIQKAHNKRYAGQEGMERYFKSKLNKRTQFLEIWRIL